MQQWINEKIHAGYGQRFEYNKVLFDNNSEHQHIQIIETKKFGRVMLLDSIVQTTEKDEFIYHEMFAHTPIFSHPNPKNVLIIGGGDGGLLKQVLKHKNIQKATLVEIDGQVIEMCKKYLPKHSEDCWDDDRVEIVIDDGSKFIQSTQEKYDLILSDSTDPIGPGAILFEKTFYQNALEKLNEDGILVTQNGVSFLQLDEIKGTFNHLRSLTPYCGFYSAAVPTYIGGNMNLAWASKSYNFANINLDEIIQKYNHAKISTQYYNPKIHQSAFALPEYVLNILNNQE